MGLPVSITICTASALNCGLNRRRCSTMNRSSQSRGPVQDPWYTPGARQWRQGARTASLLYGGGCAETVHQVRAIYARTSSSLLRRAGYIDVEDADATLARERPTGIGRCLGLEGRRRVNCVLAPADPHNSSTDTTVDNGYGTDGRSAARRPP